MRRHAEWLGQADERILEFLAENGNHPPKAIRDNLAQINEAMSYHHKHVSRRCRELRDYGLLVNVGGGTYGITDDGRAFLAGELDAAELVESN